MKTNVSIKFNSIEEYREIESKLIEMGYIQDLEYQNFMIRSFERNKDISGYQVYIKNGEFIIDRFLEWTGKLYNSLQEFLND